METQKKKVRPALNGHFYTKTLLLASVSVACVLFFFSFIPG